MISPARIEDKNVLPLSLLLTILPGGLRDIPPESLRTARALYLDLLGRPPLVPEALAAAPLSRQELAAKLLRSPEFFRNWLEEELYYFLLIDNFRPSGENVATIPERLGKGEISIKEALWQIVICPEFNARNPGADTFVTVVLEQLLGITVQKNVSLLEAGKKLYDGYPAQFLGVEGKNQADVVRAIFENSEFAAFYLDRLHRRLFGEAMPEPRRNVWIERFAADPKFFLSILEEWFGSELYAKHLARPRKKSDAMFVQSLFVDLLGRAPSSQEHRNLFNALQALSDSTPIRSVLARVILDSGQVELPGKTGVDFGAFLEEWFLRFYARLPSPKERAAFVSLWKEAACTPKTMLLALATHPEYQYY